MVKILKNQKTVLKILASVQKEKRTDQITLKRSKNTQEKLWFTIIVIMEKWETVSAKYLLFIMKVLSDIGGLFTSL